MYLNILFLVLACSVTNVLCGGQLKIPCALDDSKCTTLALQTLYKRIMAGIPEIDVPSSDPLHQNQIFGFVHDMNYTLTDAYMHGMKDCIVENHSINVHHLTWSFILHCPCLVMKSIYEVKGIIGGNYIEGKGPCVITHDKYHISMRGGLEFYEGVDRKPHMKVIYFDFKCLEVLGNTKYNLSHLYYGDDTKSKKMHKYLNENWKSISSYAHYPAMYAFMSKFLDNINIFLVKVPAHEIFYSDA